MTEHPGEQFPPSVDPDVEPQPEGSPVSEPDYDAEPAPETDPSYDAVPAPVDSSDAQRALAYRAQLDPDPSYDAQREAEPSYQDEGGHPLVEETMARLDDLRERPVSEHAEVYADVHERLQTALVEADAEHGA
ncbi:MAG TPA: hypothetical protein VGD71_13620 [Kribbella sp.]